MNSDHFLETILNSSWAATTSGNSVEGERYNPPSLCTNHSANEYCHFLLATILNSIELGLSSSSATTSGNVILPESSLNTHFTRDKRSDYGKILLFFISEIYDMLSRDFALSLLEIFLANLFLSKYYKYGNTSYQLHIHKTP
ncbi:unnamed protein product [Rhizophagus irregularis]|uniref:Uncharacterized protein n=1 Tax=Rhizophagus irregularis TaxID=588596 RepID=A0A915ZHC6_9GLOM|nr:unnamed protein product [Rhizophagus irregularis]